MVGLAVRKSGGGVIFTAKIVPGSSRTAVCGLLGEMLKIRISAAPEKGKANQFLIVFLAEKLGVKKTDVSIVAGRGGAVKQIQVLGISPQILLDKLDLN